MASTGNAALIHQFDAAGEGNSESRWNSDPSLAFDGVWNDELTAESFTLEDNCWLQDVMLSRTSFTKTFRAPGNKSTRGGFGSASFGQGADELMFEVWFRGLGGLTTDENILFESGGSWYGAVVFVTDDNGPKAGVYVDREGSRIVNLTLDLAPLDGSDFIQLTALLDDNGNSDTATLVAQDVQGHTVSNWQFVSGDGYDNSVVGGNVSGVFTYGGSNVAHLEDPGHGYGYNGDIALVNVYDEVDETVIATSYGNIVPEPTALCLMSLTALALLSRRPEV